ncbi:MAG: ERCC4 domain-containing protein [archaeon]
MIFKQIENIFSKKESREKNSKKQKHSSQISKTEIIIDTREKQSLVAANLTQKGAHIKFETLEIADYLIENGKKDTIAIERKTFSDFISSMINKRLFMQLNEIKKYPKYILLIEGKREIENKNLENASKGMILSIITEFKVPIIFTEDEEETATFILLLAKRQEKKDQEISMRPSKSNLSLKERKQFILEGFPGIGPTTAKQLLKKYKSLKNIFNASEEELKEILKSKAEDFQKYLD